MKLKTFVVAMDRLPFFQNAFLNAVPIDIPEGRGYIVELRPVKDGVEITIDEPELREWPPRISGMNAP